MSNAADEQVPAVMRAEIKRELARQQYELAAEQHHLADIDDTPIGAIRRQAAALHTVAAVAHERAAVEIEGGGHVET